MSVSIKVKMSDSNENPEITSGLKKGRFNVTNCSNCYFNFYFNKSHTGCLIKNASTHNFFIYYPISMNKKNEDMVFYALRSSHKIIFFWRYFQ
jgi:hypothetical protein